MIGPGAGTAAYRFVVLVAVVAIENVVHGALRGGQHAQCAVQRIRDSLGNLHVTRHHGSGILGIQHRLIWQNEFYRLETTLVEVYTAVTVFRSEYSDFIENFYNIPGTSNYTYRNLNEVEIWGIELAGAHDLSPRSWLGYTLAYQEGKQRAMAGGDKAPFNLAPLTASVTFGHEMPQQNLSVEAVTTMASEVKNTANETGSKPDSYAILDLYGNWRMRDNAVLNVGVQNVFDTRYFTADAIGRTTTPSTAVAAQSPLELTTGAGRTLKVSLDIEF